MNGKFFRNSVSALIAAVLILLIFFKEPKHQWMFIAVFCVWAASLLIRFLSGYIGQFWRFLKKKAKGIPAMYRKAKAKNASKAKNKQHELSVETQEIKQETDEASDRILLGHLSCRITEKLKSVFPDATWQWQEKLPERIAKGGTGRIRIEGADEYSHADITVDKYFRLSFAMMKIVNLKDVNGVSTENNSDAESDEKDPCDRVNVSDWYEWVGKEVLQEVITELNTRGYSSVFISEGGDVYVVEDGNEAVKATLKEMPVKNDWAELVDVFAAGELSGKIDNDRLVVAWA